MRFSEAWCRYAAAILIVTVPAAAWAGMTGVIGPTYPIAEESAVAQILGQLRKKAQTGELARLQKEAVRRSLDSARHPAPVAGIRTATERSERLIDPTVTYAQAVTTDDGRIVVPAGTSINPLDLMPFTQTLVFFDGRDAEQVDAVIRLMAHPGARVKPILVAGSWSDLTKRLGTQMYFDQRGILSERFGITAVPALIRQQGRALALTVMPAKEMN